MNHPTHCSRANCGHQLTTPAYRAQGIDKEYCSRECMEAEHPAEHRRQDFVHHKPTQGETLMNSAAAVKGKNRGSAKRAASKPRAGSKKKGAGAAAKKEPKGKSSMEVALDLVKRANGATGEELMKATGWKHPGTIGNFVSLYAKNKLGIVIHGSDAKGLERRYKIAEDAAE
jgi:hypothetical protein